MKDTGGFKLQKDISAVKGPFSHTEESLILPLVFDANVKTVLLRWV